MIGVGLLLIYILFCIRVWVARCAWEQEYGLSPRRVMRWLYVILPPLLPLYAWYRKRELAKQKVRLEAKGIPPWFADAINGAQLADRREAQRGTAP